jgi:predicted ATPase
VKRVLITGMSGAGKSSLLHELAGRGYRIVDRHQPLRERSR